MPESWQQYIQPLLFLFIIMFFIQQQLPFYY